MQYIGLNRWGFHPNGWLLIYISNEAVLNYKNSLIYKRVPLLVNIHYAYLITYWRDRIETFRNIPTYMGLRKTIRWHTVWIIFNTQGLGLTRLLRAGLNQFRPLSPSLHIIMPSFEKRSGSYSAMAIRWSWLNLILFYCLWYLPALWGEGKKPCSYYTKVTNSKFWTSDLFLCVTFVRHWTILPFIAKDDVRERHKISYKYRASANWIKKRKRGYIYK